MRPTRRARHPAQLAALRADSGLLLGTTDELLRLLAWIPTLRPGGPLAELP